MPGLPAKRSAVRLVLPSILSQSTRNDSVRINCKLPICPSGIARRPKSEYRFGFLAWEVACAPPPITAQGTRRHRRSGIRGPGHRAQSRTRIRGPAHAVPSFNSPGTGGGINFRRGLGAHGVPSRCSEASGSRTTDLPPHLSGIWEDAGWFTSEVQDSFRCHVVDKVHPRHPPARVHAAVADSQRFPTLWVERSVLPAGSAGSPGCGSPFSSCPPEAWASAGVPGGISVWTVRPSRRSTPGSLSRPPRSSVTTVDSSGSWGSNGAPRCRSMPSPIMSPRPSSPSRTVASTSTGESISGAPPGRPSECSPPDPSRGEAGVPSPNSWLETCSRPSDSKSGLNGS